MGETDTTPLGWGNRFRALAKANGTWKSLPEKSGWSEPAIRSWTNGHRDINLSDFLQLCESAKIDPAECLFGGRVDRKWLLIGRAWLMANDVQKGAFVTVARGVLAERGESDSQGATSS